MSGPEDNPPDLLNTENRELDKAKTVWTKLFRQILFDLNIMSPQWQRLMIRYLADPKNKVPTDIVQHQLFKAGLFAVLTSSKMTAKEFKTTAIGFLNPTEVSLEPVMMNGSDGNPEAGMSIVLTWVNGAKSQHSATIY